MFSKIIVLTILCSLSLLAQDKYFIYFKDKGIKQNEVLSKTSQVYSDAINQLSKKSIERREKTLDDDALITFEDLPIKEDYVQKIISLGIKICNQLKWFNAVTAFLSLDQIEKIKALNFVDKIEKVKSIVYKNRDELNKNLPSENIFAKTTTLDYGPSITQYAQSDIPQVHDKGINGEGVLIGLLDSGFDLKTPESLQEIKIVAEHDFVFNDNNTANEPNDVPGQDGHGTYVLSLIGGYKPGEIIGPAYKASFLLAKTENIGSEKHVEEDNYAAALEWMEGLGVDITGSSLGYNEFDTGQTDYTYKDMDGKTAIVTKAAELAFQRGVVAVNSAGNEGDKSWHYIIAPADGFNTIAVGAVNTLNQVAPFSSRGPTYDGRIKPDVLAQGVHVYGASAHTKNDYSYGQGTSSASPIVSGIAGLLLSLNHNLSNVEVRKILQQSGDNYNSPDNDRGYGLLSAEKAIEVYYPSIEIESEKYQVHKKLFAKNEITSSDCKIHYSVNGAAFIVENLISIGDNIFSFQFPDYNNGDKIDFYFTYTDNLNSYQDPASNKYFNFSFGSKDIVYGGNSSTPAVDYTLSDNYPNPFNNTTKIRYQIPASLNPSQGGTFVMLKVYDLLGREVTSLVNEEKHPGSYVVVFDGDGLSSGVYFYVLKIDGNVLSKKMVLLK
ncbi:MAG: S8 family serine peptidase [Ignavibacteriales bacterium]|nr:S8 family serine peptidase [Ignavibacteriales bacterium]